MSHFSMSAEKILSATPITFLDTAMETLEKTTKRAGTRGIHANQSENYKTSEIDTLSTGSCFAMLIHGKEIVQWLKSEQLSKCYDGPRYFFLDVRSDDEYHFGGHFATSFHVNPVLLEERHHTTLKNSVAGFKDMSESNFCLCILGGNATNVDNVDELALLLSEWGFNRVTKSFYDEVVSQLETDVIQDGAMIHISNREEAERAQSALEELICSSSLGTSDNGASLKSAKLNLTNQDETREADLQNLVDAPSVSAQWSLLSAKRYAKKGASALMGGLSGMINRVAPRQLMSPSAWEKGMQLFPEEIENEEFSKFHVKWVGPKEDLHPSEQILLVTPNFLVFVGDPLSSKPSKNRALSMDEIQQSSESASYEILNKYSLVQLRKISSRKKEPRMLIITFTERDSSQKKVGFLTSNIEENRLCIGIVKTHYIRITQVET